MYKNIACAAVLITTFIYPITRNELVKTFNKQHPFAYDLAIKIVPAHKNNAGVTLCCHGYGYCNKIVDSVKAAKVIQDHLVGFNFPDANTVRGKDPHATKFGTLDELLPLLYVIKQLVIDAQVPRLNLYGFSAGGGAIVNALAILNTGRYEKQLDDIGITQEHTKKMIAALEKGTILLDSPLKSVDEMIDVLGKSPDLVIVAERYKQNNLRPIDAVQQLAGLNLTIFLYLATPDEITGNKDDTLFIERLKMSNKGKTVVVTSNEGGHNAFHAALWKKYKEINDNEVKARR